MLHAEAKRVSKWSANVVALPIDGPATPDTAQEHRHARCASIAVGSAGCRRSSGRRRVSHHDLGWSVAEIAENLGVPTETIRSRLRYATSTLRAALDADARTTSTPIPGANGMNENEFDLAARAWLDDGPTRMSDHAVLSALEEIRTTRQRGSSWRGGLQRLTLAVASGGDALVLVVAGAVGLSYFVDRQPGIGS